MNPQNYTINIRPGWGISQVVKVSQGDVGRPLTFTIMDGQDALTIASGTTVTIKGTKPSTLGFTQACELSGNTASVETTATMTQEAGAVQAELILTQGTTIIGSANFVMYVEPAAHPEGTTDGDAETARDLMTRAQAAVAQAEAEADRAEDAAESVSQTGISTVGATAGQVPTANGAGGWSWQDQQGGGGTSDDIENASSVSGSTVSDALDSLSDEIANETTARTSAVSEVQSAVDAEASTRESADESLRQAIDNLVSPSGQSVVVDSSLSISGAAADAKKTGDELSDVKDNISTIEENFPKNITSASSIAIVNKPYVCYLQGASSSQYDATAVIDGVNIKATSVNGQTETQNKFMIGSGQIGKANGDLFITDRLRNGGADLYEHAYGRTTSSAIELCLFKTTCDYSVAAANEYLSEHPIRIWYQTPNYATANQFCEYIVCTGTEDYAVIGTTDAINPLTASDYIDIGRGVIVRGTAEESIALSGGINDIPNNVTITGSGVVKIVNYVDMTDIFDSVVMKDGWNSINPKNTSFFDNINYYEPSEASYLTGVFTTGDGRITTSDNNACSLVMPVKPNTQYILYVPDNNRGIVVANNTNIFGKGKIYTVLYGDGRNDNGYVFTTGVSDRYIFAYIYNGAYDYDTNKDSIRLVEGSALLPYEKPIVKKENLPQDIVSSASPLEGAKVLIFGDSITDTCNFTINAADQTTAVTWKNPSNWYVNSGGTTISYNMWPKILKDMGVCAEIRNYARSGASYKTLSRTEGEERQNLEYQITVALNDLSNPNGVFEVDDFVPDIVIFALGTNDGVPNDTYDSAMAKTVLAADGYSIDTAATIANLDKSKFCEAARSAFLRTRIAFPYAQFFCVLPIQHANNEVNGETLNTYLRQMARRYGCVIIDGYAESGIIRDTNVWNALGSTLKDGLHPNDKGQNMMFRMIYRAMKSNYITSSAMNP